MTGQVRTHVRDEAKGWGQGPVPYSQEAPHLAPSQQLTLGSPAGIPNSISLWALLLRKVQHQKSGSLGPCCTCSLQVLRTLPQKSGQSPLNRSRSFLCTIYSWNRREENLQTSWFSSLHDTSWRLFTLERWWEKSEEIVEKRKHFLSFLNPFQLLKSKAI